jgi:hypothetical protein
MPRKIRSGEYGPAGGCGINQDSRLYVKPSRRNRRLIGKNRKKRDFLGLLIFSKKKSQFFGQRKNREKNGKNQKKSGKKRKKAG